MNARNVLAVIGAIAVARYSIRLYKNYIQKPFEEFLDEIYAED